MLRCLLNIKSIHRSMYCTLWTAGTLELYTREYLSTQTQTDTLLLFYVTLGSRTFTNIWSFKQDMQIPPRRYLLSCGFHPSLRLRFYIISSYAPTLRHSTLSFEPTHPVNWPTQSMRQACKLKDDLIMSIRMQIYVHYFHKVIPKIEYKIKILNNPKIWTMIAQTK
jgi:hypothetical protein